MRITDTLDQLLRTLLASSTPAHETVLDVAPSSAGVPARNGDKADESASSAVTLDFEAATKAMTPRAELDTLEVTTRVAETLNLGFHLGSAVERIAAGCTRGSEGVPALREAAWLIERYIGLLERRPIGADIHASSVRLARTEATISDLREIAVQLASEPEPEDPKPDPAEQTVTIPAPAPVDEKTPLRAQTVTELPTTVNELPTLRREILVTAARAIIAVAAIIVLVLVLTLIGPWLRG